MRLKAYTVTKVEETDQCMLVHIDRLGKRLLRCGVCRQRCLEVHDIRKEREWRDSMRKLPLKRRYRPRRVECPRCGVRMNLGSLSEIRTLRNSFSSTSTSACEL